MVDIRSIEMALTVLHVLRSRYLELTSKNVQFDLLYDAKPVLALWPRIWAWSQFLDQLLFNDTWYSRYAARKETPLELYGSFLPMAYFLSQEEGERVF